MSKLCAKRVLNADARYSECGQSLTEVHSCGEELLGWVCYRGHFTPTPEKADKFKKRKRCKGCGSKTPFSHRQIPSCEKVEEVTAALEYATEVAVTDYPDFLQPAEMTEADEEEDLDKWGEIQETLEKVLATDDFRVGAP